MSVFSSVSSPKLRWISILVFAISCIILDNHNDKNKLLYTKFDIFGLDLFFYEASHLFQISVSHSKYDSNLLCFLLESIGNFSLYILSEINHFCCFLHYCGPIDDYLNRENGFIKIYHFMVIFMIIYLIGIITFCAIASRCCILLFF